MSLLQKHDADFCIEVEYKKETDNPSRVFRTLYELLESIQVLDSDLIKTIDVKIQPILILEDIESGSIKAWLKTALEAIDDDALKNLDWKPAIGKYLVEAKYYIVNFIEERTEISNKEEVKQLESNIYQLAEQTDVKKFPAYGKIPTRDLLKNVQSLSRSISYLREGDSAKYITDDKQANFNLEFQFVPDSVEDLLTKESIPSKSEVILKVRKPDYLGETMWEFRHGNHYINAKIYDQEWICKFQNREIDIRPGDSIRANMITTNRYGYDGELLSTIYEIEDVIEVIEADDIDQIDLFDNDSE
ncbi:MAG TPA: hypothetical protein VE912_13300 [Bacteroidales bacterium]|nr:hypothetical protein [Bacteroidales bacterium]